MEAAAIIAGTVFGLLVLLVIAGAIGSVIIKMWSN